MKRLEMKQGSHVDDETGCGFEVNKTGGNNAWGTSFGTSFGVRCDTVWKEYFKF
jgi:hypothetical protein